MAESFAGRKAAVNAALRRVRQQYRKADTRGEVLERELDRLINRKTIVSPATLLRLDQRYEEFTREANLVDGFLAAAMQLARTYV